MLTLEDHFHRRFDDDETVVVVDLVADDDVDVDVQNHFDDEYDLDDVSLHLEMVFDAMLILAMISEYYLVLWLLKINGHICR